MILQMACRVDGKPRIYHAESTSLAADLYDAVPAAAEALREELLIKGKLPVLVGIQGGKTE